MYLVLFPEYFNSSLFEKFGRFLSIGQKFSLTIISTVITVKLFINLTVKHESENLTFILRVYRTSCSSYACFPDTSKSILKSKLRFECDNRSGAK